MNLPSILDVLEAIVSVSQEHPRVRQWWLTPRARMPLLGRRPRGVPAVRLIISRSGERGYRRSRMCGVETQAQRPAIGLRGLRAPPACRGASSDDVPARPRRQVTEFPSPGGTGFSKVDPTHE